MSKKNTKNTEFIKPSIRVKGHKHVLEELIELGEAPELKAIGYARMGKGANNWVSYIATIVGDKVVSLEVDEPNMRPIADETTKIHFVHNFSDKDLG